MSSLRRELRRSLSGAGGFTIIELMVVVALITVLAIFAVPNLDALIPRYRLNRGAKELAGVVQMARLMAISQGRDFRICMITKDTAPTSTDTGSNAGLYTLSGWNPDLGVTGGWDILPLEVGSVASDANQVEGTFNLGSAAGGYGMRGISIVNWTAMGGPGSGNNDCMVFSTRGWLSNPATDFDGGYINIQFRNKYRNPEVEIRTVRVSRGGAVQIVNGIVGGGVS